jgi:hypothetical protein
LLLLILPSARAQYLQPDDFFNNGAQLYISNNIPAAKERVEMGLQLYPKDEKLQKLEALLKQQQQQQNQQQNQQQPQSQQSQSSQNQQSQASKSAAKQDQSQKDKEEQAKKDAEQKKAQEQQARAAQPKNGEDKTGGETNEVADATGAHDMTPKEAERLLDAQKNNEQFLTLKPKNKPEDSLHVVKDW